MIESLFLSGVGLYLGVRLTNAVSIRLAFRGDPQRQSLIKQLAAL